MSRNIFRNIPYGISSAEVVQENRRATGRNPAMIQFQQIPNQTMKPKIFLLICQVQLPNQTMKPCFRGEKNYETGIRICQTHCVGDIFSSHKSLSVDSTCLRTPDSNKKILLEISTKSNRYRKRLRKI